MQSTDFFEKCIHYFQALRHHEKITFNPVERVCQVPFSNIVIDESQSLFPCFYLPYAVPFHCPTGGDPLQQEALRDIYKKITNNPGWRQKHCAFCRQFKS